MSLMPIIDDSMVVQFRRMGKRRASFRSDRSGGTTTHVALQRSPGCRVKNQDCFTHRGELGICDGHLNCIADPFPGGFSF
jgi:hypothetical protein